MVCEVSIKTDLVVEGWATLGSDVTVGPAVTAMLGLVISEYHFTHVKLAIPNKAFGLVGHLRGAMLDASGRPSCLQEDLLQPSHVANPLSSQRGNPADVYSHQSFRRLCLANAIAEVEAISPVGDRRNQRRCV